MNKKYIAILKSFISVNDQDVVQIDSIEDGHINTTLKITINNLSSKTFILQRINHQVFTNPWSIVDSIALVNKHLQKENYPYEILEIIQTKEGKNLAIDQNNQYWRLTKYIPDTYCITKVQSKKQAFEASKTLSVFYSKLLSFDTSLIEASIIDFINFEKRIDDFKSALKNASEYKKNLAIEEIQFVENHLNLPEKFIELKKSGDLPIRIIHADPKISNVLFDSKTNKGKCVIDLDTLMPSTILYDFGDMIRSYTNLKDEDDATSENIFSYEYYQAVKEGFLSHISSDLSPIEIENLDYAAQVVVFIQSVRFLTDFLNGDIYFKTRYENHNLDRTRNQLYLLKELLQLSESY